MVGRDFLKTFTVVSSTNRKSKNSCILFLSKLTINKCLYNFKKLSINLNHEREFPFCYCNFLEKKKGEVVWQIIKFISYITPKWESLFKSTACNCVLIYNFTTCLEVIGSSPKRPNRTSNVISEHWGKEEKWDWFRFKWLEPDSA